LAVLATKNILERPAISTPMKIKQEISEDMITNQRQRPLLYR